MFLTKKFHLQTGLLLSISATLVACGGGDPKTPASNNSPSNNISAVTQQTISINTQNASAVAKTAISTTLGDVHDAGRLARALIGVTSSAESSVNLLKIAQQQLQFALKTTPSNHILSAVEQVKTCSNAGSFYANVTDLNNNNVLETGDSLKMTFYGCKETADDAALTGDVQLKINNKVATSNSSIDHADVDIQFSQLTLGNVILNGDLSLIISIVNNDLSTQLKGNQLETSSAGKVYSLQNYRIATTLLGNTGGYGIETSGRIASTDLGGAITFANNINKPLMGNLLNEPNNLTAGELIISGKDNSQIRMTALNNTQVKIELDANGDGQFEYSETKTWEQAFAS